MADADDNGRGVAMTALRVLALALVLSNGGGGASAASTTVRVGDHPGYGRIVFDLPAGAAVETVTEGDRLLLVFRDAGTLEAPAARPRNVAALVVEGATATVSVTPGARIRRQRLGDRLVVDVLDPRNAKAPGKDGPKVGVSNEPGAKAAQAGVVAPVVAAPAPPHGVTAPVATRPEIPPSVGVPPDPGVAVAAPTVAVDRMELQGSPVPAIAPAPVVAGSVSFLLPADASVGAAAFRRDDLGVVVLDRRLTLVVPPGVSVTRGQVSTTVQVTLQEHQVLRLGRTQAGWSVDVAEKTAETAAGMSPKTLEAGLLLPVARPGRVVAVLDPASGTTLLVGTSLVAAQATAAVGRRTPDYALIPAWLGVSVEPLADRVDMRAAPGGFLLTGGAVLAKPELVASPGRRFDLPDEAAPALLNRMRAQLATAAAAAPRARGPARRAAAEAMLALGMGVEAQAVLQQLMTEDPQSAADAQIRALGGAAAVLGWRLDEAEALDDPSLGDTPEVMLWRGVRDRRLGRSTAATAALPGLVGLALSYPEPLRARIWPDVAEAAAEAGVALPEDHATPYAKAVTLERAGKTEEALAAWTALTASADRLDATRSTVRAAELGLASGRLAVAAAADVLERQVFAWRGDGRELALRLRVAELRAASGKWRVALDGLRDAESLFPDQVAAIRPRKAAVFGSMLAAEGGALSPLEVVLLAAEYADCVPEGEAGAALAALLADKLMALDLPARAIPVLQGVVKSTAAGPARAEFGARLAQLLLEGGDAAGAEAALAASAAPGLSTALAETRALATARVIAGQGDLPGAEAALRAMDSARADELRATLLAGAGDWRGSLMALNDLAARVVPAAGVLDEAAQAIVIRQASAAARVPDTAALRALAALAPRMTAGNQALLQVLTEAPVTSFNELGRAASELKLARQIPQRL